ncbi:hypothetical protein N0V84_000898 [Fusarium piperis]|uniref:glutathione transferase n=1 Tax=Fusarium piperis TaxID=1435070 RepID=A0A9W8WME8_9HYPO|nr:hypothetical protein N0V84_000898 [Fusarium piperis]
MTPTVYGNLPSTRARRVLLLLEELGVEYDLKTLDFTKGEHRDSAYVEEHHPFARVPAYEDGDLKIFESRAICRYLTQKHSSPLGPPANPEALAAFEQAASIEYAYFEPSVSTLGFELIFKKLRSLGETDQTIVAQHKAQLVQVLDYYEKILEKQDYLAGQNYSLVDLFHVPWIGFIKDRLQLPELIDSRKNVTAWCQRVSSREASKVIAERLAQL